MVNVNTLPSSFKPWVKGLVVWPLFNSLHNEGPEPLKVDEGGDDFLPRLGLGKNSGSYKVLQMLKLVQCFVGYPGQQSIAVVQNGGDEGMCSFLGS